MPASSAQALTSDTDTTVGSCATMNKVKHTLGAAFGHAMALQVRVRVRVRVRVHVCKCEQTLGFAFGHAMPLQVLHL
jgi:hypothetical protein